MTPRPLSEVPPASHGVVRRLCGDPLLRERLVELGFTCGQRVEVLSQAAFGGPVQVRVRGGTIAVRLDEAACIEVAGAVVADTPAAAAPQVAAAAA